MRLIVSLFNSKPLLWLLLVVPAFPYVWDFIKPEIYPPKMLYFTGLVSTQLLVLTLCITPISFVLKKNTKTKFISQWLLARRRNFGVASFAYACIHLAVYIRQNLDIEIILSELLTWRYGSGWLAFFIMLPIAFSSNDASMRLLGKNWKRIQRWSYFVAIVTFFHWISFEIFIDSAILWLTILCVFRVLYFVGKRLNLKKSYTR